MGSYGAVGHGWEMHEKMVVCILLEKNIIPNLIFKYKPVQNFILNNQRIFT